MAQGATLTITAGADIDISEDIAIIIQGNLVIEGTEATHPKFMERFVIQLVIVLCGKVS